MRQQERQEATEITSDFSLLELGKAKQKKFPEKQDERASRDRTQAEEVYMPKMQIDDTPGSCSFVSGWITEISLER